MYLTSSEQPDKHLAASLVLTSFVRLDGAEFIIAPEEVRLHRQEFASGFLLLSFVVIVFIETLCGQEVLPVVGRHGRE